MVVSTSSTTVGEATVTPGVPVRIPLDEVRPWTPEDPHLYDVEVTLGEDRVTSYAGLRSFGVGRDAEGHPRLLLNGRPVVHVGVLDQGYWPDGLLTPPSDAAMVHDIEAMKSLGFTMLRKHVKVEPLRWYAHCDRIGMLVWQDMVNGGGPHRALVTTRPARSRLRVPDRLHRLYRRQDADGRAEFRAEVRHTLDLLHNVVSLAVWTPFNEGWGQFDANRVAAEVTWRDPARQVNHVSGWVDQGGGDIRSFHSYLKPFELPRASRWSRRRDSRVVALSEYGGYSLRVEGHDWSPREFGYRHLEDSERADPGLRRPARPAGRRGPRRPRGHGVHPAERRRGRAQRAAHLGPRGAQGRPRRRTPRDRRPAGGPARQLTRESGVRVHPLLADHPRRRRTARQLRDDLLDDRTRDRRHRETQGRVAGVLDPEDPGPA